jgi:uncharacterized secreted protein with C-terminal beta-propeller domain
MLKNMGFKSLFLIFLSAIIVASFIFLKIKDFRSPEAGFDVVDDFNVDILSNSVFHENSSGLINGFSSYDDFLAFVDQNELANFSANTSMERSGNIFAMGKDYLYMLVEKELRVINVESSDGPELISKLEFDNQVISLHLKNNNLLVFQENEDKVFLSFFDVSDPFNIIEFKKFEMDGKYFASNFLDDYIYFVVNNYDNVFPNVFYQEEEFYFNCQDGLKCLYPDIYYFDTDYSNGFNFLSVVSISLSDDSDDLGLSSYLIPRPENILISSDNIFISYTKYFEEKLLESQILLELIYPRLTKKDQNIIDEIHGVSDKILEVKDKRVKIRQILDSYIGLLSPSERKALWLELESIIEEREPNLKDKSSFSVVCRLALFDGVIEPVAEGIVSGELLSFEEDREFLGVLVFQNPSSLNYVSDDEGALNFYILDDNIQVLDELRSLSDSGENYSLALNEDNSLFLALSPDNSLFLIDAENPYNISFLAKWGGMDYDDLSYLYIKDTLFLLGLKGDNLELFHWDISDASFDKKGFYAFDDLNVYSLGSNIFWIEDDKELAVPLSLSDGSSSMAFLKVKESGIELREIVELKEDDIFNLGNNLYYFSDQFLFFK